VSRISAYDATLGPADTVSGRAFTDSVHTLRDADMMRRMLSRERGLVRGLEDDGRTGPYVEEWHENDRRHWLVIPNVAAQARAQDVTAIGFFGQARDDVDHAVVFGLEREVADSFPAYAEVGLLSYYDMECRDGGYGYANLILFWTPDVPREWYANPAHEQAVDISPRHYHSIRLHKGLIPGALAGDGDLAIARTKYFDFGGEKTWCAVRRFDPV
jgi:hypothetical protein